MEGPNDGIETLTRKEVKIIQEILLVRGMPVASRSY